MDRLPLIEPVRVSVEPFVAAATTFHAHAREPVKAVARSAALAFDAQVRWINTQVQKAESAGATKDQNGYLCTREWILDDVGYEPKMGDIITAIGTRSGLRLYVTGVDDAGHIGGGNTLKMIHFSTRNPSRGGG